MGILYINKGSDIDGIIIYRMKNGEVNFLNRRNDFKYFRKEPLLDIDQYTKPAHREELEALAQTIQNIIIMDKGTLPNDPEFGVGIGGYLFEFSDGQTLQKIRSEIEYQIATYVLNEGISIDVKVETVKLPIRDTNTLRITVDIYTDSRAGDFSVDLDAEEGEPDILRLSYGFSGNTKNNKIVSKLFL